MGFTVTGRLRELIVPCEWAWVYSETNGTKVYRRIGSSIGDDQTRETLFDWERLDYGDDGGLDETGE
jgi:hypothetical protein